MDLKVPSFMWEPLRARFPGDAVAESVIIFMSKIFLHFVSFFILALMSKKAKSQAVTRNTNAIKP